MSKEWRSLVDPGAPIPAAATKVHGITDETIKSCRTCGYFMSAHPVSRSEITLEPCSEFKPVPRFRDLAPNLAKGLAGCDFAGKNVRFDLRILAAEFARARTEWSYAGARIVDADRLEQLAVPRDLGSLHEKYAGKKHDGAHGALSDVRAAATVIAGQLATYPNLPRDLDRLHEAQWPGWLDGEGSFRVVGGVPTVMFGKHRGTPMRAVPVDYFDWLLRNDFPSDVKALAANAKLGKFPDGTT